ncbi:MAG: hypothetical protein VX406_00450 [Bacteroidota bacterium]|nr:hypothetical protein [Bacteroidota bacterium]
MLSESSKSISKFEDMLKTNTNYYFDSTEFINITHHYIDNANFSLAEKAISMGLEQHPSNIDLMLLNSELLIFNSNYDDAYKILDVVEEIDPINKEVYLQKATIYSKNNLGKKAIEILKKALEFSDDKYEIWNMIGMEFLLLEEHNSAIPFFEKCINNDYDDYQSLYNLIFCYENVNRDKDSIIILNNILEKSPYSKIAWHQLGKIYSKLNMNTQAISAFDFAIISDDEFTSAYIEKGKVLEKEKKYNEAIDNYKISIQLNEPNSFVIYRIGLCYLNLDNYKLGIKYLKKSIRIDATNESAWIELVDVYLKKENLRQASYLINKAINSNQESNRIIKKSFEINYKMGLFTEAIKNIESLIALGDLKWNNWKNLLNCSVKIKNWDKALKVALKAKKIFPKKTYIDYLISGCLIKLGKKNEAIYFFQSAKKIKEVPNKLAKNFPELINQDIFLS